MTKFWLSLALLLSGALPAAAGGVPPEMDRLLMEGIDNIYRFHFDEAEASARQAMAVDPTHPYPYFGLAGVYWTKYVYLTDRTEASLLPLFEENVHKTISLSKAWLDKHPDDPQVLMILGAAYGISSRLNVVQRAWMKAYFDGRKAMSYTRQATKVDPEYWDAYLGIGMYDYYSDLYPRFVGVLARLLFGGSRARGIETLKMVAEKGHFSKVTAQILLVEIFTEDPFGAKDAAGALKIMDELRARYPDSHGMHSARLVALYEGKRYDEVSKGAATYIELAKKGSYPRIELAKGYVFLATAQWAQGQKEQALESFRAASGVKYGDQLSRWAVWALVRAANIEDRLGRRKEALQDYKLAAEQPDLWEIRPIAKAGLSKPYPEEEPGPIPPP